MRIIKGGFLGKKLDYVSIKSNTNLRFVDKSIVSDFRLYHFGSVEIMEKWLHLLNLSREQNIPVYILTSGDRPGIIRTLQLMELENLFIRVLSVNNKPRDSPHDGLPPDGVNKYEVIKKVMKQLGKECDKEEMEGLLIDDNASNSIGRDNCQSIKFENSTNRAGVKIDNRGFAKEINSIVNPAHTINQISTQLLDKIITLITDRKINILFIDFDQTFQIYEGSLPFNLKPIGKGNHLQFMIIKLNKLGIQTVFEPVT